MGVHVQFYIQQEGEDCDENNVECIEVMKVSRSLGSKLEGLFDHLYLDFFDAYGNPFYPTAKSNIYSILKWEEQDEAEIWAECTYEEFIDLWETSKYVLFSY